MQNLNSEKIHHHLDTTGLICPEPVMLLHRAVRKASSGEMIEVIATDPATTRDIPNFCRHLGHTLVSQSQSNGSGEDADNQGSHDSSLDDPNDLDSLDNVNSPQIAYRYLIQKK